MGFEKKAKQILVPLTETMFQEVAELAEQTGKRLGEMGRVLVAEALEARRRGLVPQPDQEQEKDLIADKRIEVNVIHPSRLGEVAELARREGITATEAAARIARQENAPSVHVEDEGVTVTSLPSRGPGQQSEIERIARAIVNTVAAADLLKGKRMSDEQLETEIKEMTESLESLLASDPKPKP